MPINRDRIIRLILAIVKRLVFTASKNPSRETAFLAEYIRHFGDLLLQRIALQDADAAEAVKALYSVYSVGWARLSGQVREKYDVSAVLDGTDREIAKLSAFGYTGKEIAAMLHVSESTVSHAITRILNKTGTASKKELAYVL